MTQTNSVGSGTKRRSFGGIPDDLACEVGNLYTLGSKTLREKWRTLYGSEAPRQISRSLMIRAFAYRLQERALAGLKPSTLRVLDRVAEGGVSVESQRAPKRRATAGTVLVREWRGISHRVTVLDNDVVYRGRCYKSLSEVARAITGTHWSGPLFFGLTGRAKEAVNG